MIIINPREVAVDAIIEITMDEAYNNMALKRILKQNGAMSSQDRGFVTEVVNGSLRNLTYIDYTINIVSKTKTNKMKPWVLAVLRTAVYQIVFMDRVPSSAACNEAVKLIKEKKLGNLSGFVNGVLRNIVRGIDNIILPDEETEPIEYLSVKYSHPQWLLKMWLHEYDYGFVKELCIKNNTSPNVTVVCNTLKSSVEELKLSLEKCGIIVSDGMYNKNALHLLKTADIGSIEEFKKGHFHVQDESSMLAVCVLDPKEGEKVLDVCAAPGGKSFLIAEKMNNKGTVISRDVFDHKLELIDETAKRLGISIIKTENKDASEESIENVGDFDRVLVDAPCSGLGLIRKKPDIKLRKNGNDIDNLYKIQREILKASSAYVKSGGILVYSTCTICKKENIKNIEWFINNSDFELCDISSYLPENLISFTSAQGYTQLFPNVHDTDGFFIARMKRKEQ